MPNLGTRNCSVAYFKLSISRITVLRLFSLVILMGGYFFSPCYSIPIKTEASNNDPWWCQPCKNEHKTRHSRGINEPLKTQFSIAVNTYQSEIDKYVKHVHTKLQIANMTKKQIKKNSWLPRKKFFRKLRKDNHEILPELHKNVQIYAVTFQRLLDMEIGSQDDTFDVSFRTKTFNTVKSNINGLRCEIEQEIAEKQLPPPEKVPADFVDKYIPTAVNHLTDALMKDYSILKDYANFINKCFNKLFGRAKKSQKSKKSKKGDKQKNNKPRRTTKNVLNQKSEHS